MFEYPMKTAWRLLARRDRPWTGLAAVLGMFVSCTVSGGMKVEKNRRFEIPDEYLAKMRNTGSEATTAGSVGGENNDQLSI